MSQKLSDLKPHSLWKHFGEFLKIPHCSGNEAALGDYIVGFAKKLGLEYERDEAGNVLIRKPASPGLENSEGVVLQGHLDMVCEKNSDITHDFSTEPIHAVVDGEWVRAEGTTLGADNAIGGCAALAVLETANLTHPPLECLFTVEEETGLKGAARMKDGWLRGTRLLNLDSEDEGEFTIGCAGGADSQIFLDLQRESSLAGNRTVVKLSGFQGGHSGVDINIGRGNAVKLLARMLWEIGERSPFSLVSLTGGNLRNAIPREAWAIVELPEAQRQDFQKALEQAFDAVKEEYRVTDPDAALDFEPADKENLPALTEFSQRTLLDLMNALPHGVMAMHPEIDGLVETSTNLAVVRNTPQRAEIICSTRSSTASSMEATRNRLAAICRLAGADINQEEGYPGWMPDTRSELLKVLKALHIEMFEKEAHVAAIHAGLECGIIGDKHPGMDMISFGPTIKFPHSPGEKVDIGTVERFWEFLIKLLERLA